jgi:putative ABC transport system permease protein
MIRNYFILFVRNLVRQKLFSTINLLGLTVSIASTLLIYLYVRHEFSFDRFHRNADRIYRVNQTFIWGESDNHQFASTGPGVAYALKEELPEAELITSIHTPGNYTIAYTHPDRSISAFEEEKLLAADSNFFGMFDFPFIKGSAEESLLQANTMVMTESIANKYFGNEDPIGKLVTLTNGQGQQTYEVTGVIKDTPENTYLQFDALLSMNSFPQIKKRYWSWVWTQLETYILLEPGTDLKNTRAKLAKIPAKFAEETLQRVMNTTYADYIKSGKKWELFLQPLTAIHLPSEVVYGRLTNTGNLKVIYSLIGAALFIVLLSCINFMNLSTAQFTRRIKEASIRKIMGLGRMELSLNYFLEALAFCFIALVAAIALTQLLLPGFNYISGKTLEINFLNDPGLIVALLGVALFMGLVSGSYPALFLSAFQPAEAIKGKLKTGHEGRTLRNGLVIFQFGVSIFLIICTAIVFEQLKFVSEKDLGFDKENLLVVSHAEHIQDAEGFANATLNVPGVVNSTLCLSLPPTLWGGDKFTADGMDNKTFSLNFTNADERFIPTLNIKLKLGRNFSADALGDANRVILNETALKQIGWPMDEASLGKKIQLPGGPSFEVVGIVKDFNYWSLATPIEPMAIFHIKNREVVGAGERQYVAVRIAGQNSEAWKSTLSSLQSTWKNHAGDYPFQYSFVDEGFADAFKTEQQFGKALTVMAGLAILIAGLGLLGMIVYMLEQRTKEIGIRKVSGASSWNILVLVSRGYAKLILIAFLLGAPLSYWMMQQWLRDFAYRVTISPWVFAMAGIGTMVVAMLIASYHSVKAALTNPVVVLRDE